MPDLTYLDHAASTPMRDVARAAMVDADGLGAANASGSHRAARRARAAVEDAREALATVLGADPGDVVFTSGGTEADNLAVLGRHAAAPGRVLCTPVEHPAVLVAARSVGAEVVPVGRWGDVDLAGLEAGLDDDVSLVSVMTVNNEVGTIEPIAGIAEVVRRQAPRAALHTDAVQALPWLDLREITPHVDLLSVSAHKFGGPQGVGACVVRNGCELASRQLGGGQERERRSGTLNVAGIVAMAAAAVEADAERATAVPRLTALRDRLVQQIRAGVADVEITVDPTAVLVAGGFAHLCFAGVDSEELLFLLDQAGVCASAGSACASGAHRPSHVLEAIGIHDALAAGALRLTLGHTTTGHDVDVAAAAVVAAVRRLREHAA